MAEETVDSDDARRALELAWDGRLSDVTAISAVERGVNEVFIVRTGTEEQLVCKFATFSRPRSFRAGAAAYQLLDAHTALPVPAVDALRTDPPGLPAFQVMQFLPGSPLAGPVESGRYGSARALGAVIAAFASVPERAVTGYGTVRETAEAGGADSVGAEYDDCADWFVDYTETLYEEIPDHDRLAAVAPAVPSYVQANRDRLPAQPETAVVVTDFGPSNLLAPGGTVPGEAGVGDLTGVVDLERAKLGPAAFTAVNAEYLMTRDIDDPKPVVEALYEPLPFGPALPCRELYRLVAMGRSVGALDLWYEAGSERFQRRGDAVAAEIERYLD
jgi:aminoglycoside phosphotransferase (APT) family kinase protein